MKVSNTQEMAVLLDALQIRRYEWTPTNGHIELHINAQQLMYAINQNYGSVENIFGNTPEWKELTDLFKTQ